MILRAWFDADAATDLRHLLLDRKILGVWPLSKVPERQSYVLREDLVLEDGSNVEISALCDKTLPEPSVTLCVLSGEKVLFCTAVKNTPELTTTVATGRGGFLVLQIQIDPDAEAKGEF